MAAKGGHIDFMFLASPSYPAAGSATGDGAEPPGGGERQKYIYANFSKKLREIENILGCWGVGGGVWSATAFSPKRFSRSVNNRYCSLCFTSAIQNKKDQ